MTNTTSTPPRFVILTAIDASASSERVVSAAIGFARVIAGAEMHIVHVMQGLSQAPSLVGLSATPPLVELREAARSLLERSGRSVTAEFPQMRVVTHLSEGIAWKRIVQLAANIQADLVLVGTHDYGAVERFVLGSVASTVARKAPCPVLVVRAKDVHKDTTQEIEPACVQCVRMQRETRGATLWCERHAEHHLHARLHYEYPESFAVGSTMLQP